MIDSTLHFPDGTLFDREKSTATLDDMVSSGVRLFRSLLVEAIRFAETLLDGGISLYTVIAGRSDQDIATTPKKLIDVNRGENDLLD